MTNSGPEDAWRALPPVIACYFPGGDEIALAGGGVQPGCGGSAAAVP